MCKLILISFIFFNSSFCKWPRKLDNPQNRTQRKNANLFEQSNDPSFFCQRPHTAPANTRPKIVVTKIKEDD